MPIRTLFVANRREIAVRIIRAAKALGMRAVQAVSSADREMLAARMADEIAEIGPPHAAKSYLNKEAVVAGLVEEGIPVRGRIPSPAAHNPHNVDYLRTKRERTGHLIELFGEDAAKAG